MNAHTHVYSALAAFGLPDAVPPPTRFLEILERVWWRLDRALDLSLLAVSAKLAATEARAHGVATTIDHHESPECIEGSLDVIADAFQAEGVRAVVTYGATERNGGREEARRGLAECARFVRANQRPLVRGLVGLHASFTVSDDTIREAGDLCRELGVPLHVHVAEDAADVRDAVARGWAGPLERLRDLGALPAGSVLAHGVWLDRSEVRAVRDAEAWIVQNPRSNRGNGVGYPRWLAESDRVALGTDGWPPDLDAELAVLLEEAAAHGEDPGVAATRAEAGAALADALFGGEPAPAVMPPDPAALDEARAEGRAAADRLRARLSALD